jgi:hypothetical protein
MDERKTRPPLYPVEGPGFPPPEPLQAPKMEPQPLQAPGNEPIRPPMTIPDIRPRSLGLRPIKPHVYVKVSSYKQIMDKLAEMSKEVIRIRNLLNEMGDLTNQENQKLSVFNQVLTKMTEDLDFVENIFTEPEE